MDLATRRDTFRNTLRLILRPTNIPAALALFVIVIAALFAEYQNRRVYEQSLRADVLGRVSSIRNRLEGDINGNIQLLRGLIATLSTEPQMKQERFAQLAANLLTEKSKLRNIAAAPDMVISLMYPLKGNERAIGLDYRKNPAQREAALRARDTGEPIVAGPVDLVQGGRGFIARLPVFVGDGHGGKTILGHRLRGHRSSTASIATADFSTRICRSRSPLPAATPRASRAPGSSAAPMRRRTIRSSPMSFCPPAHGRSPRFPRSGWHVTPSNVWQLRLFILLAGGLIMIPTVMTGRLIGERMKNIGELKRREIELQRLSRRLELALDTSQIGVWEMNIETDELVWDDRMNELYGYPADGGPRNYTHWERVLHPDDIARARQDFQRAVATNGSYQAEYRMLLDSGELRHVRESGMVYRDAGEPARIVGVNWDVTADVELRESLKRANTLTEARNVELETAKARIQYNALHDSLTGLPNRRYLDEVLAAHIETVRGGGRTGGTAAYRPRPLQADQRHARPCRRRRHADACGARPEIQPARRRFRRPRRRRRIRGSVQGRPARRAALERALAGLPTASSKQMHQPVLYEGHECRFGVSIGIASDLDAVADPHRLLVNADIALYRAKSRGRNRYQFFNDALQAEIVTTKRIADDILSGLERNEFVAYYQPQFDAATFAIVGVEALARWNHPDRGPAGAGRLHEDRRGAQRRRDHRPHDPRADACGISTTGRPPGCRCRRLRSTSRRAGCTTRN